MQGLLSIAHLVTEVQTSCSWLKTQTSCLDFGFQKTVHDELMV